MKIRKINTRSIFLGIILSTFTLPTCSLASSNYEELSIGKILHIKNTLNEEIQEIEIFGETIQDINNLSDIVSVGDLYVDKDGNPILDKKGNKQYKIKVVSRNINLLNNKYLVQGVMNYGTVGASVDKSELIYSESNKRATLRPEDAIPVRPNEKITCKSDKYNIGLAQLSNGTSLGDTGWVKESVTITTGPNTTHIALNISKGSTPAGTEIFSVDEIMPGDIMIYYGDEEIDFTDCISNEIEVILPHQLQKLGDVSDRMYYDKYTNSFIVEKNIEDIVLDGTEKWYALSTTLNKTIQFGVNEGLDLITDSRIISDRFTQPANAVMAGDKEMMSIRTNTQGIPTLYMRINRDRLETENLSGFKKWLGENNTLVKYIRKEPVITKISLNGSLLNFYDNATNIFVQTPKDIQPDIKVKVNKLLDFATTAVSEAIINKDTESISRARYLVNMMKDSLIKDSLQQQISNIINESIENIEKLKVSNTVDIYIKSKNTVSLSLNTNSIVFEDFNGVEDMEKKSALKLTVGSSLPYDIKVSLETPIQSSDTVINNNVLSIKESNNNAYLTFDKLKEALLLVTDEATDSKDYYIDMKLNKGLITKPDVYKSVIKFELIQK